MPAKPLKSWYPYYDASRNFQECTGWEVILREIFTVLVTRKGSRQWNPEFGCGLQDLIFEVGVQESDFQSCVSEAIKRWVPQVTLESVSVGMTPLTTRSGYKVSLNLKISYAGESKDVAFDIPSQMDLLSGAIHQITVKRKKSNQVTVRNV